MLSTKKKSKTHEKKKEITLFDQEKSKIQEIKKKGNTLTTALSTKFQEKSKKPRKQVIILLFL